MTPFDSAQGDIVHDSTQRSQRLRGTEVLFPNDVCKRNLIKEIYPSFPVDNISARRTCSCPGSAIIDKRFISAGGIKSQQLRSFLFYPKIYIKPPS